jgi:hypothetical protein
MDIVGLYFAPVGRIVFLVCCKENRVDGVIEKSLTAHCHEKKVEVGMLVPHFREYMLQCALGLPRRGTLLRV